MVASVGATYHLVIISIMMKMRIIMMTMMMVLTGGCDPVPPPEAIERLAFKSEIASGFRIMTRWWKVMRRVVDWILFGIGSMCFQYLCDVGDIVHVCHKRFVTLMIRGG